ncbi:MAG TPA: CDP-glycerol glycerophosphotransferase family protein, partial [Burkholderiaceae bacterium]|nr:CDP-glycerol glycerophosphotransferase family protein [Burkholderiaceae bacterium]
MSALPHLAEQRASNETLPGHPGAYALPSREEVRGLRDSVAEMNDNLAAQVRMMALAVENVQINERLGVAARISPKERRVVFIGSQGFGGNIKYAWLDFACRAKEWGVECWFAPQTPEQDTLAQSLGLSYFPHDWKKWTREHTGLALRTAVRVTDTHFTALASPNPYPHALFSGAHEVQLWHGISIKEIALRSTMPLGRMSVDHAQNLASCRMEAFCGSSAAAESEWRRWFNFDRYANLGYPRNDVLLREPTELDLLNVDTVALRAARRVHALGGKVFFY